MRTRREPPRRWPASSLRLVPCEITGCPEQIKWQPGRGGPPKRCLRHRNCRNSHGARGEKKTAPKRDPRCPTCGGRILMELDAMTRLVERCVACHTVTLVPLWRRSVVPNTTERL